MDGTLGIQAMTPQGNLDAEAWGSFSAFLPLLWSSVLQVLAISVSPNSDPCLLNS